MSKPRWLTELFSSLTNGELQGGKSISYPTRKELPRPRPDQYRYQHSIGKKKVYGTHIPASTLSKFRSGKWTPGPRSLKKLKALRDRYNYHRLRASGANTSEARKLMRSRTIEQDISIYRKTAQTIAEQKGVDIAAILWSNRRSDREVNSWEQYIKAKYKSYDSDEEFDDEEWDDYLDTESTFSDDDEVEDGDIDD